MPTERMTPRQRMLVAMAGGKPDRVPCSPDTSNMMPCRLTGKPFWDIYLHNDPPLWKAYIALLRHFGVDGKFAYGGVKWKTDSGIETRAEITARSAERVVQRHTYIMPEGRLTGETVYMVGDPPTESEKPVKDVKEQFAMLRRFFAAPTAADFSQAREQRRELGEMGAFGLAVAGLPGFHGWIYFVQGGVEALTYAYYDHPELFEELRELNHRKVVRQAEMILGERPDFLYMSNSGSLTLQSADIFRHLTLPTLKEVTRLAKQAGIPTLMHSCGRSMDLVEMVATETDLCCLNPLEAPPMGDADLAEVKRRYGKKLALMGNLLTTDVMLRGTPELVREESRKCIEAAGAGGGFILSTGDQCGRDTPDANILAMLEACREFGRYD
ncbi:MAG TPA: uroporphyrinogen decarboxylase family protein [Planctomycetota bacterium]|nr:uroporphyrinogen decarboxylase family protein [Planctomycetota bacterium]